MNGNSTIPSAPSSRVEIRQGRALPPGVRADGDRHGYYRIRSRDEDDDDSSRRTLINGSWTEKE